MTRPLIGWYAHHVGSGHVTTARLVARATRTPVVVLSSAPRPADWPVDEWVELSRDDGPGGREHDAGGALHWAPIGHDGYDARMRLMAGWVATARPTLMVSDVSVEVTVLARMLGVPVATMVMAGDRTDRPHQLAHDAASALFAPFPAGADVTGGFHSRWAAKTTHLGAMSRFDGRALTSAPAEPPVMRVMPVTPVSSGPGATDEPRRVTMLWGHGGSSVTSEDVRAAAAATPGWAWTVCDTRDPDEVWALLRQADVVVAHAGQSVVGEVAAARRPAVIVPQPRPHDEQLHLARGLVRLGLTPAVTAWPAPEAWPTILDRAAQVDPSGWAQWSDGHGADRMAAALDRLAGERAA